jgi:IS1 family transposase
MNQLATDRRTSVIAALVEGASVNSTCRMTGVAKHTVLKLLKDMGCACAAYHNANVRNLRVRRVECDEIWQFVGSKAKNTSPEKKALGWGDVWTWTAIDADTKLIISCTLGDRGADTAHAFMQDVAGRTRNRIQLTTDGHRVYADAVEDAFGADIDYAMLVKIYGASNDNPESRYSPATCIGCRTGVLSGDPDPDHISTSFVGRSNLSMRMGMRRFTRLTNRFSKKLENHGHMVALYFMHYNFCRVHKTLRVTPAMEAGLADHVWTLEELCNLLLTSGMPLAQGNQVWMIIHLTQKWIYANVGSWQSESTLNLSASVKSS